MALVISKASDPSKGSFCYIYLIPGVEYTDTVTIAPDAVISQQPIGVATQSNGFQPYDGVLA